MEHLLSDHEIAELPGFLEVWEKYGQRTDEIVQRQCIKKQRPLDDEPTIENARKASGWNDIETYEERFCINPRVAIHLFTDGRLLWRPVDPTEPVSPHNPEFGDSYKTFKELAEYLVQAKIFTKEQLFPTTNPPAWQAPHQVTRPDPTGFAGTALNGQHISSRQSPNGDARNPQWATTPEPEVPQNEEPTDFHFSANGRSTAESHTVNPTSESSRTASPATGGVYPLDLLLALRRAYTAKQSEDLNSFQTAVALIRNHPPEQIEKTAEHTVFHKFDPEHPNASLKATYRPNLRWAIELRNDTHSLDAQIPLPSQFAKAIHLQPFLAGWNAFKKHLPFYEGRLFPPGSPGENGFLLLYKDLNPLFTFESARTLNRFLDPDSAAQQNLIKICLIQASLQNRQSSVPHSSLLPVPASSPQRPPAYYQSEPAKLHALAYTLNLNNHPDPGKAAQMSPMHRQEALALLCINAPELMPAASAAQQALYRNIARTLKQRHPPLTDQNRAAIARYFPQTCQNAEFIECTIKKEGILPSDLKTRYNLLVYACENADAQLLEQITRLAQNQGETIRLKRGDPETFTRWILDKTYPDRQSAKSCLQHLPLSPLLRLSLNSQLKQAGWKQTTSPRPPRIEVNI